MRTIWKYTLNANWNPLEVPVGYKVLSVIEQYDEIVMYLLVDPSNETEKAEFFVSGTGIYLEDSIDELEFVGTVSTYRGSLICHVFKNNILKRGLQ